MILITAALFQTLGIDGSNKSPSPDIPAGGLLVNVGTDEDEPPQPRVKQTTDTERKLAAMGLSSSADFASYDDDDDDDTQGHSQAVTPLVTKERSPSPLPSSGHDRPPSYDIASKTKKVKFILLYTILLLLPELQVNFLVH